MRRINVAGIYQLGSRVHPLANIQAGAKVSDIIVLLAEADEMLARFLASDVGSGTQNLKEAAKALRELLQHLTLLPPNVALKGMHISTARVLTDKEAEAIRETLRSFEELLFSDLTETNIFFVEQKGLHNVRLLIEQADTDFPLPIRLLLPPSAIDEIRAAGRALAFDLFTASAFHIMRVTELVLLELLKEHQVSPEKESQRNWGNYIRLLEGKVDGELLLFLKELAKLERNETIHPAKMLIDVEQAKVYGVVKMAIVCMIEHLQNRRK